MPDTQLLMIVLVSVLVAACACFIYARKIEPRRFKLEQLKIKTQNIGLTGIMSRPLRILHISDLHLCYPEKEKLRFLQETTEQEYDLIFLTGDVFENFSGLCYAKDIFSRKPRLGAYAVLGNHDYYNYTMVHKSLGRIFRQFRHPPQKRDVRPMVGALESAGFKVLRDEAVCLPDSKVHIVGIDYPYLQADRLKQLVSSAPDDYLKLVLFHVPIYLGAIAKSGAHAAFGGHTHGGQIRIPGFGAIITDSELPRREASGLFWREQTAFHISRGLGADPRTNIRFFCPPAATVVEVI